MKVIINVGVSGSGKSTWTAHYIKRNPNTVRINRDDLRKTLRVNLYGYYQNTFLYKLEELINSLEEQIYMQALIRNLDVVIDNTNLKESYINRWIDLVENFNEGESEKKQAKVYFKIFRNTDVEELKKRVNERDLPNSLEALNYIDKQVKALPNIISFLETHYEGDIINE